MVLLIGIVVKASRVCLVYPAQTASCLKASLLPGFLRTAIHVLKNILHGPDIVALCPLVLNQRNPLEHHKNWEVSPTLFT